MYDYLIVGAGLFGSIFACEATKMGKKCLVIEKRNHIGGNMFTQEMENIFVHKYGAHIFHTSNDKVWNYMNQFISFLPFVNSPIANYHGKLYNLPFNLNTFYSLWNCKTPLEAKEKISQQTSKYQGKAVLNLEDKAKSLVGDDIYEILIKGYTEKQWGKPCSELPPFIINRLPLRFTFDNNYFNDTYQGIPLGGYTPLFEQLLKEVEVRLQCDFFENQDMYEGMAHKILFTGEIDAYFHYQFGPLEYRSLRFDTKKLDCNNFQGNAVINYTDSQTPYTRIIEHKHFERRNSNSISTILTYEYPLKWEKGLEPYYPINDEKNNDLYHQYQEYSKLQNKVIFGGRLGTYKYYDMNVIVEKALELVEKELYN